MVKHPLLHLAGPARRLLDAGELECGAPQRFSAVLVDLVDGRRWRLGALVPAGDI